MSDYRQVTKRKGHSPSRIARLLFERWGDPGCLGAAIREEPLLRCGSDRRHVGLVPRSAWISIVHWTLAGERQRYKSWIIFGLQRTSDARPRATAIQLIPDSDKVT